MSYYKPYTLFAKTQAAGGFDSDAQAFFTASGLSDNTQRTQVNNLIVALKAAGLWTGAKALYGFVGGTADFHKWNLRDPRDLDAAFRLSFVGTWSHGASGADPNGTNAYANTFLNPSTAGLTASAGAIFIATNETGIAASASSEMGCAAANNDQFSISIRYTGNLFGAINTAGGSDLTTVSNSDSNGIYLCGRTATNTEGYKNGTRVINAAHTGAAPNANIYVGAINGNGTAAEFSSKRITFAGIYSISLTTTNVSDLQTILTNYNTGLSR